MEIALYILSAIGSASVLLFFYFLVRQVLQNFEGVESLKRWNQGVERSLDKAHDRYHDLSGRVEELESVMAEHITDRILSAAPNRRRK